MKKLLILMLCLSVQSLFAQERETRPLSDFTHVEFVGRGNLYLIPGNDAVAEIEITDSGEMQKVKTWVSGKTLHIEYKKNDDKVLPLEPKIDIYLTYQQLEEVRVTGIVNVQTEQPISSRFFSLNVEGMGKNNLDVEVKDLEVRCAGTANIYLSGKAENQEIMLDGTGTIDAYHLKSNSTTAEVNGTGSVLVNVEESLVAEANGLGAEVRYRGNPQKKVINKSGFARIKRDNSQ